MAGSGHEIVELRVAERDPREIPRGPQPGEIPLERRDVVGAVSLGGQTHHLRFDELPHLEDLGHVPLGECGYPQPARRRADEEPVALERDRGLPHRHAAHAEPFGRGLLGDLRADRERAGHDLLFEDPCDPLRDRVRPGRPATRSGRASARACRCTRAPARGGEPACRPTWSLACDGVILRRIAQAMISRTTWPWTSVSRSSRPP